jgi:hypothetical protein
MIELEEKWQILKGKKLLLEGTGLCNIKVILVVKVI